MKRYKFPCRFLSILAVALHKIIPVASTANILSTNECLSSKMSDKNLPNCKINFEEPFQSFCYNERNLIVFVQNESSAGVIACYSKIPVKVEPLLSNNSETISSFLRIQYQRRITNFTSGEEEFVAKMFPLPITSNSFRSDRVAKYTVKTIKDPTDAVHIYLFPSYEIKGNSSRDLESSEAILWGIGERNVVPSSQIVMVSCLSVCHLREKSKFPCKFKYNLVLSKRLYSTINGRPDHMRYSIPLGKYVFDPLNGFNLNLTNLTAPGGYVGTFACYLTGSRWGNNGPSLEILEIPEIEILPKIYGIFPMTHSTIGCSSVHEVAIAKRDIGFRGLGWLPNYEIQANATKGNDPLSNTVRYHAVLDTRTVVPGFYECLFATNGTTIHRWKIMTGCVEPFDNCAQTGDSLVLGDDIIMCGSNINSDVQVIGTACENRGTCAYSKECTRPENRKRCLRSISFGGLYGKSFGDTMKDPGGVVNCFENNGDKLEFGYEMIHFRGFDGKFYFEYKNAPTPPINSLIVVTGQDFIYTGGRFKFDCKVHSFFSGGELFWKAEQDGVWRDVVFTEDEENTAEDPLSHPRKSSYFKIEDKGFTSLMCLAPLSNSEEWINITYKLDIVEARQPAILETDTRRTFRVNSTVAQVMKCSAVGVPTPSLHWFRNGQIMNNSASRIVHNIAVASITFSSFNAEMAGEYECFAASDVGTTRRKFQAVAEEFTGAESNNSLKWILIILSAVIVLVVAISTAAVYKASQRKRELTYEDIDEFFKGKNIKTENPEEAATCAAYDADYELRKDNLCIDSNAVLGLGEFGVVYKGKLLDSETQVAVKTTKTNCKREILLSLLNEIKIYMNSQCTILGQTLARFSWKIATGMLHISMIHRDISARNILLGPDLTCKISDFGLSKKLYQYSTYLKKGQEPLPWKWMAVESLRDLVFSTASDVWSYGVTLFEIYSLGSVPYPGLSWNTEFVRMLDLGVRNPKPESADDQIYEVMMKCWNLEPEARPTFKGLVEFFKTRVQELDSEKDNYQKLNDES